MIKKYKLLKYDYIIVDDKRLYRIRSLKSLNRLPKGTLGGYVESEDNLSHESTCWIYDDAMVIGNAHVKDSAKVQFNALVKDNAEMQLSQVMLLFQIMQK